MQAQDHPEYSQEAEYLRRTISAIESQIKIVGQSNPIGGNAHATDALRKHAHKRYETLSSLDHEPYFGRIDFAPNDTEISETYYIGKSPFSHNDQNIIIDWRAPVAELFYKAGPGEVSYKSPSGKIKGSLHLKRNLKIQGQKLLEISDVFDLRTKDRSSFAEYSVIVDPDEYLRNVLEGRRDAHLKDIVETIQSQQYDLIQADAQQVLVIQGVAGSGKTSVALHRIAFLLYPENLIKMDAGRCVIFGPNQLFLKYVSTVLPALSIDQISQKTMIDWACEEIGIDNTQLTDNVLDVVLSPHISRDEKIASYKRSQLKNSHHMGTLLQKFTEYCRAKISLSPQGFTYSNVGSFGVTFHIKSQEIEDFYKEYASLPLVQHRERVFERLKVRLSNLYNDALEQKVKELSEPGKQFITQSNLIRQQISQLEGWSVSIRNVVEDQLDGKQISKSLSQAIDSLQKLADYFWRKGDVIVLSVKNQFDDAMGNKNRQQVLEQVYTQLKSDFEKTWAQFDVVDDYYGLVGNRDLLGEIGAGILSSGEIDLLHQTRKDRGSVDLSDLSALHYLHVWVKGASSIKFDHVVIDEAQDVSRLHFEVIKRYSQKSSFTILGDLSQSIYAHRGISNWDEVKSAFSESPYRYGELNKSYRSTYEISKAANLVLQSIAQKGHSTVRAELFERHGEKVEIYPCRTESELLMKISKAVESFQQKGCDNIAIVTKTIEQATKLHKDLKRNDQIHCVTSPSFDYRGGIIILPVHLAKGMEFEAVIVSNASEDVYSATEFDGRLLYVAVTRALHLLSVVWVVKVAWHLEQIVARQ